MSGGIDDGYSDGTVPVVTGWDPAAEDGEITIHSCLDIKGALTNWSNEMLAGMFAHTDGRPYTAREVKAQLLEYLSEGKEVLPLGVPCEGFSYKTGCPGHRFRKSA